MTALPSKPPSSLLTSFSNATLSAASPLHLSPSCHKTAAFYRDSSGRARVRIRARLTFDGDRGGTGMAAFVRSGCVRPAPAEAGGVGAEEGEANARRDDDDDDDAGSDELSAMGDDAGGSSREIDTSFSFECAAATSATSDEDNRRPWAVERVSILKSRIERDPDSKSIAALAFDVEVAVRGNGVRKTDDLETSLEVGRLELRAVLTQREKRPGNRRPSSRSAALDEGDPPTAGLLGLELGGGALSPATAASLLLARASSAPPSKNPLRIHYASEIVETPPLAIEAVLVPPLRLAAREVCGARAASGSTLVEIAVEHPSDWHGRPVTVTGIAFHPGQSRLWDSSAPEGGKSMQGGELSVVDMSRRARWGFCPGTAPELPLELGPYEAWAAVITIDAGEDVRSRAFLSPVSVNAVVGGADRTEEAAEDDGERVMVSTDVRWTTSRVAVENSDAFKVDMSLRGGPNTVCRVGAPLIVSLRVLNLSMEPRDLMLLMAKDGEGRNTELQWERPTEGRRARMRRENHLHIDVKRGMMLHNRTNAPVDEDPPKENQLFSTAVVSEVNGYTFGVWGLSGDDDGTTRHHRDHELLAVDAALLLGEVKGQHSIEAELRFVPLREGTLDVPNLKLYDKRGGRWYNCVHTLKIVAAAKA